MSRHPPTCPICTAGARAYDCVVYRPEGFNGSKVSGYAGQCLYHGDIRVLIEPIGSREGKAMQKTLDQLETEERLEKLDLELKQIEVDMAKAKLRLAVADAEIREREARGMRPLGRVSISPAGPKGAEQ